ncbi:MAG: MarR family EPS-associated transcriptional regulator [Porticoccaceae bacterium]
MSQQELEYKVLNWLEKNPNMTQRQLAKKLGVSLGKTHYLINSLIQVGWIKLDNFKRSDNKIGYMYLVTPAGMVEKIKITRSFLARKQTEYQQLKQEIQRLKSEVESF